MPRHEPNPGYATEPSLTSIVSKTKYLLSTKIALIFQITYVAAFAEKNLHKNVKQIIVPDLEEIGSKCLL